MATVKHGPAGPVTDALYEVRRAARWLRKAEATLARAINAEKRARKRREEPLGADSLPARMREKYQREEG